MTATSVIVAWVMSAMLFWSPPDRPHFIPEAQETKEEAMARYEQIAKALVDVTYNPANEPIFVGTHGRAQTTMLLLSLAFSESGFRKDIDLGLGKKGHGDKGGSHCMMQIFTGKDLKSTDTVNNILGRRWSGQDLVEDREKCFTTGYNMARRSFKVCKRLPFNERLAVYASGSCNMGLSESRARVDQAMRRYKIQPPPLTDVAVLADRQQIILAALEKEVYDP